MLMEPTASPAPGAGASAAPMRASPDDLARLEQFVPLAAPTLPPAEEVLAEFRALLTQSQLTNGRFVERLEREAAAYLGIPECVAVSSCTAGLMLVLRSLGLTGEVIVPSFTFFATAHAVLWNGLEPVLADCGRDTFNIDVESVERVITARTAAILAVHVFGQPAAVDALQTLARRRRVPLIFDGAHAFGAEVAGNGISAWGDATVFSLSPTKPLVAGEGGLIATRDATLAARLRQARNYGKGDHYDCAILGLNARMTEFQAALAVCGLPYVDVAIEQRNRLAEIYESRLREVPGLRFQQTARFARSSRKDFAIVLDPRFGPGVAQLQLALEQQNIETRRYFEPPLHRQVLYRRYYRPEQEPLCVTDEISSGVLCLPLYSGLAQRTVVAIAERVLALRRTAGSARGWAARSRIDIAGKDQT